MRAYQARPERLRDRIAAEEPGLTTVVIDEVQKAPQLPDVVHSLVEERPLAALRFIRSGQRIAHLSPIQNRISGIPQRSEAATPARRSSMSSR